MGSSSSKHKKASKKSNASSLNGVPSKETADDTQSKETLDIALKDSPDVSSEAKPDVEARNGKKPCSDDAPSPAKKPNFKAHKAQNKMKKGKCKQRQQTKHGCASLPSLDPDSQIKGGVDNSPADSSRPPSIDSGAAPSDGTSQGSHELENVLTEQIRTLEREKHDLTADLPVLNLGPVASEDDNFSADDLDASSVDDLDMISHQESVTFDTPASPSKLNHLNKNRAPKQKKRPPARYSMFLGQDVEMDGPGGAGEEQGKKEGDEEEEERRRKGEEESIAQAPHHGEKVKKKGGSKDKKKKKGKYNKKADGKLDDSVVEV